MMPDETTALIGGLLIGKVCPLCDVALDDGSAVLLSKDCIVTHVRCTVPAVVDALARQFFGDKANVDTFTLAVEAAIR